MIYGVQYDIIILKGGKTMSKKKKSSDKAASINLTTAIINLIALLINIIISVKTG